MQPYSGWHYSHPPAFHCSGDAPSHCAAPLAHHRMPYRGSPISMAACRCSMVGGTYHMSSSALLRKGLLRQGWSSLQRDGAGEGSQLSAGQGRGGCMLLPFHENTSANTWCPHSVATAAAAAEAQARPGGRCQREQGCHPCATTCELAAMVARCCSPGVAPVGVVVLGYAVGSIGGVQGALQRLALALSVAVHSEGRLRGDSSSSSHGSGGGGGQSRTGGVEAGHGPDVPAGKGEPSWAAVSNHCCWTMLDRSPWLSCD